MATAGIPRLAIRKILNHLENGVTAICDRHGYDGEKRKAMEEWGERLEKMVGA